MDAINKRVVNFLVQTGKSKSEFANELNVSPSIISHVSSGRNKVGLELVQKMLERYTGLSANWLLTGSGAMFEEDNAVQVDALKKDIASLKSELNSLEGQFSVFKRNFEKLSDHFN